MNTAPRNAQVPTWCGALVDADFVRHALDDARPTRVAVTPTPWQRMRTAARTMWERLPHRKEP